MLFNATSSPVSSRVAYGHAATHRVDSGPMPANEQGIWTYRVIIAGKKYGSATERCERDELGRELGYKQMVAQNRMQRAADAADWNNGSWATHR
jgi:hypothetical protein